MQIDNNNNNILLFFIIKAKYKNVNTKLKVNPFGNLNP